MRRELVQCVHDGRLHGQTAVSKWKSVTYFLASVVCCQLVSILWLAYLVLTPLSQAAAQPALTEHVGPRATAQAIPDHVAEANALATSLYKHTYIQAAEQAAVQVAASSDDAASSTLIHAQALAQSLLPDVVDPDALLAAHQVDACLLVINCRQGCHPLPVCTSMWSDAMSWACNGRHAAQLAP